MQEDFLIQSQSLKDRTGYYEDNHSMTEAFVRDAAGNAFEFGVSSDAQNATTRPTLFTTAWTAGNFNGYEAASCHQPRLSPARSTRRSAPAPSSATGSPAVMSGHLRREVFRHIPESYWPGGFSVVTGTQTYGEVYDNSPGGSLNPTMNGRVSNYHTNTGSHLTAFSISYPYRIPSASGTGFTFGS